MKKISTIVVAALITVSAVSSSYAIAGIGFHWGFDLSMSMDDVRGERLNLPMPELTGLPPELAGLDEEIAAFDFFRVSRENWGRSAINFGGKAYIDLIPFFDIEVSGNFGLWQYDGSLEYLDINNTDAIINGTPAYKTVDLTLKDLDMKHIGLTGTPYAKLHFDATVRKTILDLWLIKFSGGAGMSAHFATPLLTGSLIEDALGSALTTASAVDIGGLLSDKETGKTIVTKIIKEAMGKPALGAHVLLGVKAKLPVIPVGVYIDGKYMFPFSNFDKDAGDGKKSPINGYGLLVNAGLSLSI
jgi:hypothetical protein